jgi:hypothetical protein
VESGILKWYGHLLRMGNNRGPMRIFTWSTEGRKVRASPYMKWKREVEGVIKQKDLTPNGAVNLHIW